ncbi:MAG TPA: hypothetical protein VML96_03700 [Egibacteraceae bacterium]|nr:hypothetical protein [Egibacteraceae bacterium]
MTRLITRLAVLTRPVGLVRVSGPDRLSYLHTLLSQQVEGLTPGAAADFLYLDAKGNPLAAGRLLVGQEDVLLAAPSPATAADLAAALEKFKFLLQVDASDVSDELTFASIRGPGEIDVPGAPPAAMTFAADGSGLLVRDRGGGVDLIGSGEWVAGRLAELALPEASREEWEAWRILAGEPAWGAEIAPGRRAQELGLLPTHVHLRKGCYPGQELIAKIYNLGRPRRALAVVELDGPVAPGDQIEVGGKAGEVTSAAATAERWVALALLPVGPDGEVGDSAVRANGRTGRILHRVGEGFPQPGAPARRSPDG